MIIHPVIWLYACTPCSRKWRYGVLDPNVCRNCGQPPDVELLTYECLDGYLHNYSGPPDKFTNECPKGHTPDTKRKPGAFKHPAMNIL